MKKNRKYKHSDEVTIAERKARRYASGSHSSDIGLITDEGKEESTGSQCSTKSESHASARDIILVRPSSESLNTVEDMKSSSDSDESDKEYRKAKYKPSTNGNSLYPDIKDCAETEHQENKNVGMFMSLGGGNKYNTEAEIVETKIDETDDKQMRKSSLEVSNFYQRNGKNRVAMAMPGNNNQKTSSSIWSFEFRCITYVAIACFVSILFASLLSYLSYRK